MLATEEGVPLPAVGTGALNSMAKLSTGEDADMLSGDAVSLKLLAEFEDMLELFNIKQQHNDDVVEAHSYGFQCQ